MCRISKHKEVIFMLIINFRFNDIKIESIEKEDMIKVGNYISKKDDFRENNFDFQEFNDRFLEYYISESEFFLKVEKDEKIIGVIKGRVEFKKENEIWFWYFNIDEMEDKYLFSSILKRTIEFFKKEVAINNFYAVLEEKSPNIRTFMSNNFKLSRVSKNFFEKGKENLDMIILKLAKLS